MSAFETAHSGADPADPQASRPSTAEVTSWLLDGRWFTIDLAGQVTLWGRGSKERFGYGRKEIAGRSFVETLIAPPARPAQQQMVTEHLEGQAKGDAGFTGDVVALDSAGGELRAAFALVPIQLSVGYRFNELLQEISKNAGNAEGMGQLKSRHGSILELIEDALSGKAAESAQTEEGGRLAGALVVFRAAEAGAAPVPAPAPPPDNVVSIADAAGLDEARAQLERLRPEIEEARTEVRNLEGQLEEARREAQRSRNEVDVVRQEAKDARDELALSQRQNEELRDQLDSARRGAEEARASIEAARIRQEESQREADGLRAELRDARDAVRGAMGRADDDLARIKAEAESAERDAADARAEAARHEAEVVTLRGRLQSTQRELGELRAEFEAARAELTQGQALGERRGSEIERLRGELEERGAAADALRAELEERSAAAEAAQAEVGRLGAELEAAREAAREAAQGPAAAPAATDSQDPHLHAAFHGAPVGAALVSPDGRFIDVNPALCNFLGIDRERLLSDDPPAIVHPDDLDGKRALHARLLAGEQQTGRAFRRYLRSDGTAITMRETTALLRDPEAKPELFVLQLEPAAGDEADEAIVDADVQIDDPGTALVALDGELMRRALEDDLFELHGQPVLDLRTNMVSQYELLLRMIGPDGKLIMPSGFLGAARRAGLAHAIDRWVVRHAIALISKAPENVSLEVNLSPEAIFDPDLATVIDEELAGTPIDPARLVLEVTGATAAQNLEETRKLAKRVRALGCRFALDDFRSNFGSLRLLKDLPLDYLKLDGELVGSLQESRTSQLIVKALVDVANGTGTKTVAVFVSDEETLALLRQQGVDYAQGYRIGRPKQIAELWPGDEQAALPAP